MKLVKENLGPVFVCFAHKCRSILEKEGTLAGNLTSYSW